MCLIAFAWRAHPRCELALIANRDEFHARPAAPAGPHPQAPEVFGGRDLEAGGSWLLVASRRRLAAVTNVRAGTPESSRPRSRGALVDGFVRGSAAAADYAAALAGTAGDYGRFNLILWDGAAMAFASNHPRFECRDIAPGLHAMSNGAFDAPWPKSGRATAALQGWLAARPDEAVSRAQRHALETLFVALADITPAPDDSLPETGVGLEMERTLSPPFVRGERYGTRCSTVVLVDADGLRFVERRFGPLAAPLGETDVLLPAR